MGRKLTGRSPEKAYLVILPASLFYFLKNGSFWRYIKINNLLKRKMAGFKSPILRFFFKVCDGSEEIKKRIILVQSEGHFYFFLLGFCDFYS